MAYAEAGSAELTNSPSILKPGSARGIAKQGASFFENLILTRSFLPGSEFKNSHRNKYVPGSNDSGFASLMLPTSIQPFSGTSKGTSTARITSGSIGSNSSTTSTETEWIPESAKDRNDTLPGRQENP
jgi:hypothetical protein